ncbi:MAG: amidophosphoribosyltransferase [Alphaproteobacteria bacterium]|nr:amidophosphoribosyltransferase [Alphaproteobacteria bacterium]
MASARGLPFEDDHVHDECGVFGIFGTEDAAAHTALGLHALQHRGQEAAGIVSYDGRQFHSERQLGLVADTFSSQAVIERLKGHCAVGHNRYATTGETMLRNVQPLFAEFSFGGLSVAHNGNLTNGITLRRRLTEHGSIFQSTTDTEAIIHLIATSNHTGVIERLIDALRQVEGAYSFVVLTKDMLIGVRDPLGVRPLVLGRSGAAMILASETCALDIIGAEYLRSVEPGELIVIDANGVRSLFPFPPVKQRPCVFELVYFARPDSLTNETSVYKTRKRIGAELARESHIDADVVIPVPDSGTPAAMGYAEEAHTPFELGIIRNHYVGRTFIEPSAHIRHLGVKLKHSPNRAEIVDKRVILVDDSIVRGTTSKKIVDMVRHAGAREVHMRIASPPTTHSCFYGVDTPSRADLLAANYDVEGMRTFIGADSLAFVSIDGLYRAMGFKRGRDRESPQFCDACFSGDYPIRLRDMEDGVEPKQLLLLAENG